MPTATMPQAPEKIELSQDVQAFINCPVVIKSSDQNQSVAGLLQKAKGEINRLDADRKTFTKPLQDTVKAIIARYDQAIEPLKRFETAAKNAMAAWELSERQRIAKENARLQAQADEKARKEAERLAARAEKAEAKGNLEKAEEFRQEAENVQAAPAPIVYQQKASGVSFKDSWEIEVINPDLVPRNYCIPNESRIKSVVNSMAGKIEIPGIKITHKLIPASRSI